jgi:hypothetical protein
MIVRGCLLALLLGLAAGCGPETEPQRLPLAQPAGPQTAALGWREAYAGESPTHALRFVVDQLRVTAAGWEADVAVTNDTQVAWRIGRGAASRFGVQLFADDDLEALEEAGREGRLPPERRARSFSPEPPRVLQRRAEWRGTIAAPGRLPAGAYVRVVFGPFAATTEPPDDLATPVVWITDHAHRLASR